MKIILLIFLFYSTITCFAQDKNFISSGKTHEILNKYFVNEYVLKSDSTYVQTFYTFENKTDIENYKELEPKLESTGIYLASGKYYLFEERNPNNLDRKYFKLSNRKLIQLFFRDNKWRKGGKFKFMTN